MNYKKEINDNYTLHLIKTDKFKDINISIRLTKVFDVEEFAYLRLLEKILRFNKTKKYNSILEVSKELERLYNSNMMVKSYASSKNMVFEIGLTMVNPKYTDMSVYDGLYDLFEELITNQKTYNNQFDEEIFENEKENLIKSIENVKDQPEQYGGLKFEEVFYKNTVYGENNLKNIDVYKNLTNKKLYQVYKKLFNTYKIDALVIGDFEEEIIKEKINKGLKNFKQNDNSCKDLRVLIKEGEVKGYTKKVEASQSNLFIGCTVNNLTDDERNYKLVLYNTILGSMNNSVLFVNVRELNSLCYHISSVINRFTDTIVIESGINAKNFNIAYSLIEKCLEDMKDKETIEGLIKNAKKTLEIAYNDFYDNKDKIMTYYYMNEFTFIPSIEVRRKRVEETTIEEIIEIAKKVKIKDVFLLEGSTNEEN